MRFDFWGLTQITPLHSQVGEGVETEWLRGGESEGMSGSGHGTRAHGRSEQDQAASPAIHWHMRKLGMGGKSGWAKLQYLLMNVRAGGRQHEAGPQYPPKYKRARMGANSVVDLWAHLYGTAVPACWFAQQLEMLTDQVKLDCGTQSR